MKKSELEEMIRQAMLEENQSTPPNSVKESIKGRGSDGSYNYELEDTLGDLIDNKDQAIDAIMYIASSWGINIPPNLTEAKTKKKRSDGDSLDPDLQKELTGLPPREAIDAVNLLISHYGIDLSKKKFPGKKISEAEEDKKDKKEEEEDIEIEDIEGIEGIEDTEEIEDIPSSDASGITGDEKKVQDSLESALIAAKELGDEKLINQIGNSITFFTRSHVVGSGEESLEEVGPVSDYDAFQDEGHPLGLPDFKDELDRNVEVLSRMITPMDSAEGVIQWLMDNPDDIPSEVDEDFFYDNLDQIREKLLQIDLDSTIGEAYEKRRMLKIAGLK